MKKTFTYNSTKQFLCRFTNITSLRKKESLPLHQCQSSSRPMPFKGKARGVWGQGRGFLSSSCPWGRGQSSRSPSLAGFQFCLLVEIVPDFDSQIRVMSIPIFRWLLVQSPQCTLFYFVFLWFSCWFPATQTVWICRIVRFLISENHIRDLWFIH